MSIERIVLLSDGKTWQAEVVDERDGYVLEAFWAGSRERVLRRCEKFIRKHRDLNAS